MHTVKNHVNFNIYQCTKNTYTTKQEESARERALCQLTECF